MIKALKQEVENAFDEMLDKYTLKVKQFDKYSVYLVSDKHSYAVGIYLDRDGLVFMYYDLCPKAKKIYNLYSFLVNKRREKMTFLEKDEYADKPFIEEVQFTLPFVANNIKNAGSDILAGDKTWIKQYHRSTADIPPEIYAQLTSD